MLKVGMDVVRPSMGMTGASGKIRVMLGGDSNPHCGRSRWPQSQKNSCVWAAPAHIPQTLPVLHLSSILHSSCPDSATVLANGRGTKILLIAPSDPPPTPPLPTPWRRTTCSPSSNRSHLARRVLPFTRKDHGFSYRSTPRLFSYGITVWGRL
jgi:hypothetical protein